MTNDSTVPTGERDIAIARVDLDHPADQDALRAIFDDYASEPIMLDRPMTDAEHARLVDGLRAHPASFALVARIGDEPAGVAVCFEGFSTFHGHAVLNIHDVAVRRAFRGQGVGSALLDAVEQAARARGCGTVTLEVDGRNDNARRLYERRGFDAGDPPMVFMKKRLDEAPVEVDTGATGDTDHDDRMTEREPTHR